MCCFQHSATAGLHKLSATMRYLSSLADTGLPASACLAACPSLGSLLLTTPTPQTSRNATASVLSCQRTWSHWRHHALSHAGHTALHVAGGTLSTSFAHPAGLKIKITHILRKKQVIACDCKYLSSIQF